MAGTGQTIRLWDLATGKEVRPRGGHQEAVTAVVLSRDGRTAASGSADRTIRLWDPATGRELRRLTGHADVINHLALAADGRTLISAGADNTVRFWETATGKEFRHFPGGVWALSADGRYVLLGSQNQEQATITLCDSATGKVVRQLQQAPVVWGVAVSPDGRTLFTCGEEKRIHVWEVATGKLLRLFGGLPDWTNHRSNFGVVFSPDGRWVAVGAEERGQIRVRHILVYDLATGKQAARLQPAGRPVTFSPDGRLLACTGGAGEKVQVLETATGQECRSFTGHQSHITTVAFSADGKTLVSGSGDTTVLVWDVTGSVPQGRVPAEALQARELEPLWADLGGGDAARAQRALWILTSAPRQTVPFVAERLQPIAADARQIQRLIADLDSDQFATREKASAELERLDRVAEVALRQALTRPPSLEARKRLAELLGKLDGATRTAGAWLQAYRAIAVLEHIGTPEARRVLRTVAAGAPEARLTQEARASLERLTR
jgi:sugar lactone lactonase YvrE